jgi:TrpR-related protein YerC/YecD
LATDDRLRSDAMDRLFEAVLELRTPDECYRLFEDLCTVGELHAMAQRWEVARRLESGQHYQEIAGATGASTATISRVKRCLDYGADGYRMMLGRLKIRGAATPKAEGRL